MLKAYRGHVILRPEEAAGLSMVTETAHTQRGVVTDSQIDGVNVGDCLYVSLVESLWINEYLAVPEAAILAIDT